MLMKSEQSMSQKPGDRSWEQPQRRENGLMEDTRRAEVLTEVRTWVCSGAASWLSDLFWPYLAAHIQKGRVYMIGARGGWGVLESMDLQP